jgi:hypothetical protein
VLDRRFLTVALNGNSDPWIVWHVGAGGKEKCAIAAINALTNEELQNYRYDDKTLLELTASNAAFTHLLDCGVITADITKIRASISKENIEKLKQLQRSAIVGPTSGTMSMSEIKARLQEILGEPYGGAVFEQFAKQ